jgi:hypothetical protein
LVEEKEVAPGYTIVQSIYTVCLVPMHPTYKSRHFKSVMWKPNMFLGE